MLKEQDSTRFSDNDELRLHEAREGLARYDEITPTTPEQRALAREKARTEAFLKTEHGRIAILSEQLRELRRRASAESVEQSNTDLNKLRYEPSEQ